MRAKDPRKRTLKKPCWCYTGEINTCGECDREFVSIDLRFYRRQMPEKIRKMIDEVMAFERATRKPFDEPHPVCYRGNPA